MNDQSHYALVVLVSCIFVGLLVAATLEVKEAIRKRRKRISPRVYRGFH